MPPIENDDEGVSDDVENHEDIVDDEEFVADADDGDEDDGDSDGGEDDSGENDDDGEDEGREPEGRQTDVEKPKRKGIGDIRREAREAKAKADALEKEIEQLKRGGQQHQAPKETPEQRQAKLAAMTPEARSEFLRQEDRAYNDARFNQLAFQNFEATDKATFEAACARNPAVQAIRGEVEKEVAKLRENGQVVTRETAAAFLLGKKVLEGAPGARKKAQQRADDAKDRNKAKPSGGRSDQTRQSRKSGDERAKRKERLMGMKL